MNRLCSHLASTKTLVVFHEGAVFFESGLIVVDEFGGASLCMHQVPSIKCLHLMQTTHNNLVVHRHTRTTCWQKLTLANLTLRIPLTRKQCLTLLSVACSVRLCSRAVLILCLVPGFGPDDRISMRLGFAHSSCSVADMCPVTASIIVHSILSEPLVSLN
jgi:hypothetical protein